MGIKEKIENATIDNWLTDGLSRSEIDAAKALGRISTEIEIRRLELKMTQKEFAKHMGVTQGMVSKWESGEYNFTIETLYEICSKLDLTFNPTVYKKSKNNIYSFKKDLRERSPFVVPATNSVSFDKEMIA